MVEDVTDLEIYGESLRLLKKLYDFLRKIPRTEYDTVVQCKKCGKSIPSNVAEGWAKRFWADEFRRFLKIAIGSSDELVSHLTQIAIILPVLAAEASGLANEYKTLSKRMNSLWVHWHSGKK